MRDLGLEESIARLSHRENPNEFDPLALLDGMPETDSIKEIPVSYFREPAGRVLVITDNHAPFHNGAVISNIIELGSRMGITGLLDMGDHIDFYSISRFEKDPAKRSFRNERDKAVAVWQAKRKRLGDKVEFKYLEGNHEHRYARWLFTDGAPLYDLPETQFAALMKLEEIGVEYIEAPGLVNMGGLYAQHGDMLPTGGTVNPSRSAGLKALSHVIRGHSHRVSTFEQYDLLDPKRLVTSHYYVGWCGGRADYAPFATYQYGYAIVDYTPDSFSVQNFRLNLRYNRWERVLQ